MFSKFFTESSSGTKAIELNPNWDESMMRDVL
jgi:hypothetical protein